MDAVQDSAYLQMSLRWGWAGWALGWAEGCPWQLKGAGLFWGLEAGWIQVPAVEAYCSELYMPIEGLTNTALGVQD